MKFSLAMLAAFAFSPKEIAAQSTDPVCNVLAENPRLLEFPALSVPCPAVGERVNVAYSFRKTLREISPDANDIVKASIGMTVAHDGANPVAGISYGYVIEDVADKSEFSCDDITYNLTDIFFKIDHTEEVITGCQYWTEGALSDVGGFCQAAGLGDAGTTEKTIIISAWNDGGCEGDMQFKAVLQDALTEDTSVPASVCLSSIEPICEDVTGGTGGPPFDPSTVAASPDNSAASQNAMRFAATVALASYALAFV